MSHHSTLLVYADDNAASAAPTDDYDRGPQILAICGAMVGLALLLVGLRLLVRVRIVRTTLGWDDYFMMAAALVLLAEMIVIVPEVQYGAGRHVQFIEPASNIVTGLHLNFVTQPLCLIALCFTKISVGLFLLRLTSSGGFGRFIWAVIVVTAVSAAGNLLTVFFQCTPLAFLWDSSIEGGMCIPSDSLKFAAFFNSAVSLLTDVIFALLPIPMLWNVQLNWRVKIAVAGILSLGIFASASAIVKMTFLSSYGSHGDFLWDSADITIWTTIEICTAMIGASIPSLKPLFKAFLANSSSLYSPNQVSGKKGYLRNTGHGDTAVQTDSTKNYEMYGRRTKNSVTVVTAGGVTRSRVAREVNESEESILVLETAEGIRKTTRVSVSIQ